MINKAILLGNLCADPEVRPAGTTNVANMRLATNSRRKGGDNWEDVAEFHNVVAFGKTAENVGKYCSKGKKLYIEGRIQTRKWQDKAGADRWSTEVVIGGYGTSIRTLKGGTENGNSGSSTADDGDIPFDTSDDL